MRKSAAWRSENDGSGRANVECDSIPRHRDHQLLLGRSVAMIDVCAGRV